MTYWEYWDRLQKDIELIKLQQEVLRKESNEEPHTCIASLCNKWLI